MRNPFRRRTPYTESGLRQYDNMHPVESVVRAWMDPGPHPDWHEATKQEVRDAMPLLARSLDRLAGHGE